MGTKYLAKVWFASQDRKKLSQPSSSLQMPNKPNLKIELSGSQINNSTYIATETRTHASIKLHKFTPCSVVEVAILVCLLDVLNV